MSLQAENAKQLLLSIVNQLDQHTWDKLSSLEKEQVKRKLVEAFDQLFPIQNLLADKEPLTQVKEAIIVPLVKEKQEEKIQEIPEEVKPVVVKETPEPLVEVAEIVEQKSEPSVEIKEEIKTPVPPVAQEEEDSHKASLNEKFTQEKTTLADKIARPQGSLKTSIDVNEKFFFIRDLFGSDNNAYDKAIRFLDNLSSYDDAMIYIERELAIQHKWEAGTKAREKFMKQVKSRFGR